MNKTFNFIEDGDFFEEGQTTKLRLALCIKEGKTYMQAHPFIKCRDFLGDVLYAIKEKKKLDLYNFHFDGTSKPIESRNLVLLLESTEQELENIKCNLGIITKIEDILKIKHSKLEKTDKPNIYLLFFPKYWGKCNLLFSFYTFLLRCCCYKIDTDNWVDEITNYSGKESKYITNSLTKEYLNLFINILPKIKIDNTNFSGLPKNEHTIEKIHHSTGFISLINNIRINFLEGLYGNIYGLQLVKLFEKYK